MAEDLHARDARVAAEMDADVGREQVADVYAEALLAAAQSAGRTDAVWQELDSLVRDVLDAQPGFEEILSSGLVSHDEKLGILNRVFGSRASGLMLSFLKVLSRRGRMDCLRAVHRQARRHYDELLGRVPVRLSTAAPIPDALARQIVDRIRGVLDAEPVLQRETDPSLIGGLVVRVGDTVYDGSVANQLQQMRQQMIDRSAHEIQSRRNRFRDPAGD